MCYGTKKILLIGNGFDLRTGVKTTFREFIRFIIYGVIWHNYSKSEVLKTIITNDKHLTFKVDSEIPPEEIFPKYFNEKIKNKVKTIADVQREEERKKREKDHPGEKLLPSKHPLEILLEIDQKEKKEEEKEEEKRITVFDYCRMLIDTEFGKYFFKHLLKSPYLEEALRIDLSSPIQWFFGYKVDNHDANDKFLRWSVIYGLKDAEAEMGEHNCIPNDTSLGEGLETIAHIVENNLNINRGNIALWSDVETVIELFVTRDKNLKNKYNLEDDDLPKWNDETLKSFSEGVDIFELLLTKYLAAIQNSINIDENFADEFIDEIENNHKESFDQRSHNVMMLSNLLQNPLYVPDIVINYNYTNIAERIYQKAPQKPHYPLPRPQHIHINGSLEPKYAPSREGFATNIVIGYTNHNNIDVQKELYHFEKSSRRIVKNTEFFNLETHLHGYDNFDLLIIGHSCCTADSDVIGSLLEHDKLQNALILCHTKDDLISINNNIRHILKPEKYGELMTHKAGVGNHNLFYAVERPKEENKNQESKKKRLVHVQKKASLGEKIGKLLTRRSRKIVKTAQ